MRDYDDPVYKAVRLEVLKRDKHRCQMPGCKSKFKLNVHHIIPWSTASSLRYDKNNCITLCQVHHKEVTGSENLYVSLFHQIVDSKKKK